MNKRILSIDKAVSILTFISLNGNNCRLVDIQKSLNLPKSTLSGLVSSLEDNGLLFKNPATSTYSLGLKLFEFGQIASTDFSIKEILRPYLEELSQKYNESVHLAINANNEVLYIDGINSTHKVKMCANPGTKGMLYNNSLGKIFMAHMSSENLNDYLENNPIPVRTPHTLVSIDSLRENIEQVKKTKVAFDHEESELGLICLASEVVSANGDLIAAFALSVPTGRLTDELLLQMQEDLLSLSNHFKTLF